MILANEFYLYLVGIWYLTDLSDLYGKDLVLSIDNIIFLYKTVSIQLKL